MKPIVVKIGGSVLNDHDTTLEDLVMLQMQEVPLVVVHGGGQVASEWLIKLGISTSFINGLRVTDAESLKVVTAVLGGLVNKELVVTVQSLGGKAIGISGSDGKLIQAKMKNRELSYTGEVVAVDPAPLRLLLEAGYMPLVAPIGFGMVDGKAMLLNVNGDTAAGAIAAALAAEKLVFMTDVDGIHDDMGKVIPKLDLAGAQALLVSGAASGGMVPKIEASVKALDSVSIVRIIDGTKAHALLDETGGTIIAQ
ncbi:MAG: acetylglutamate kinase [Chloroflexota bacterium]|nr:acetylglutamate kinase [Chloroflexota bacterium]